MNDLYSNKDFIAPQKDLLFSNPATDTIIKSKVHVRIYQRNGKKSITTIEGLEDDLDLKRICRSMRKTFNCNGNVTLDKNNEQEVIQLQGDQRENVRLWLTDQEIISKSELSRLVIHGF
jgi:translation initiation factor 1